MGEAIVHRDKVSSASVGLTPSGLCVVVRLTDGSQRAEVFLDPQTAESMARLLEAFGREARANALAAAERRLA